MTKSILCKVSFQSPEERAQRVQDLAVGRPRPLAEKSPQLANVNRQVRMWRVNPECRFWRVPA